MQKPPATQSNLKKEKWSWRIRLPDFRLYYETTTPQNGMELAQKQKYRSMEQDRKPRNKSRHHSQLLYDKGGKNTQW